jgi:hypothetical protein
MVNVITVSLQLDEAAPDRTVEEQADDLLALWGSAPMRLSEDADLDDYYVHVESVDVKEVQEQGKPVRIAQVVFTKWPDTSGE